MRDVVAASTYGETRLKVAEEFAFLEASEQLVELAR